MPVARSPGWEKRARRSVKLCQSNPNFKCFCFVCELLSHGCNVHPKRGIRCLCVRTTNIPVCKADVCRTQHRPVLESTRPTSKPLRICPHLKQMLPEDLVHSTFSCCSKTEVVFAKVGKVLEWDSGGSPSRKLSALTEPHFPFLEGAGTATAPSSSLEPQFEGPPDRNKFNYNCTNVALHSRGQQRSRGPEAFPQGVPDMAQTRGPGGGSAKTATKKRAGVPDMASGSGVVNSTKMGGGGETRQTKIGFGYMWKMV